MAPSQSRSAELMDQFLGSVSVGLSVDLDPGDQYEVRLLAALGDACRRIAELEQDTRMQAGVVEQQARRADAAEARIAELEAHADCHEKNHEAALDLLDEARKRVDELEAERRWTPTSERLPDRDGPCLGLDAGRPVFRVLSQGVWLTASGMKCCAPEFWMAMPEGPEATDD